MTMTTMGTTTMETNGPTSEVDLRINIPQDAPGIDHERFGSRHFAVPKSKLIEAIQKSGTLKGIIKDVPEGVTPGDVLQTLADDPREFIPFQHCDNQLENGRCGGHV